MSLVARILETIKGGDEAKVTRLISRSVKYVKDQISAAKRHIEDLQDSLTDLQSEQADALLSVDVKALGSVQSTKNYVPTYIANIASYNNKVADVKDKIAEYEAQVAKYEAILEQLSDSDSE